MKEVKCKQCGKLTVKYERDGSLFCDNKCYFTWKKSNPNKKAYRGIILVSGYLYVYMPSHPNAIKNKRYIGLHRLIAEWKIKRRLKDNEISHHIDGNTLNNDPLNISVMTFSEHCKLSKKGCKRDEKGKFK